MAATQAASLDVAVIVIDDQERRRGREGSLLALLELILVHLPGTREIGLTVEHSNYTLHAQGDMGCLSRLCAFP